MIASFFATCKSGYACEQMAKLVGMISLDCPFVQVVQTEGTSYDEEIRDVAFDDEGKAWGLVTRLEPLTDHESAIS